MKLFRYLLIDISIITSTIACQTVDDTQTLFENGIQDKLSLRNEFLTTEGQTILGDVIDIPYSIENLLKAYENLPVKTKSLIDTDDIIPTHYYVKFYPKSIIELDILRNIKPYVFLSETPLDRKVEVGGYSYHDPSIPDNLPTYQYTVVPVSRWAELKSTIPVEAEILIKAYIPDYDEAYTTKSEAVYGIPAAAYDALLREAYKITGNDYDVAPETKANSWTPTGRIRAYDNIFQTMTPVPGVRIRAIHLLKVKETLTNEEGRFTLPSFNNPVTYKVVWESDDWDIRNGLTGQATFDGPTISSQWFLDIGNEHEKNVRYAATQRAAYTFYYRDVEGLNRPVFDKKLKICQRDSDSSTPGMFTNANAMGWHIESWIHKGDGSLRNIDEIYCNIAHELGHAAHYSNNSDDYNDYSIGIKESWAEYCAFVIYKKEYGVYRPENYSYYEEGWPNVNDIHYSPIFLDLEDNYNQRIQLNNSYLPNDDVSGYTGSQLSGFLNNTTYTLSNLKTKVNGSKPLGITEAAIDSLFSVYEEFWIDDYD